MSKTPPQYNVLKSRSKDFGTAFNLVQTEFITNLNDTKNE